MLHSFNFTKTYQGIAFLSIKYVSVPYRNDREYTKFICCSTIEKAFIYGFSRLFIDTPIAISFFNLEKDNKPLLIPISTRGSFFNSSEIASYLYVLTSIKGSAFFFANIQFKNLTKYRV